MVSLSFSRLATLCAVVSSLSSVLALPSIPFIPGQETTASDISNTTVPQEHELIARTTPSAPHFVVYTDSWISGLTGPPPVSKVKGFNVVALAFILTSGTYDKAQEWASLSESERKSIKAKYAAAGIKLIVSVFGGTDAPTTNGANAISTANKMAKFVKDYDLDGIDVDYEDFDAMNAGDGRAETWIINFTKQLRTKLPKGQYILSHAPVAPWFAPGRYGGGGYLKVHQKVGNLIDWYYNQDEYTTCSGLLTKSSSTWPETSVFQIAANGVPLNKLVIGKPGSSGDASNGYMAPATLAGCLKQAKAKGWNGGAMFWQYPQANAAWIKTVRSKSFPV
ncbi:glycoside hydrolase family 18 protein [Hysterangium stoloniferum]|nr:glycoside hydrolase family 18 protein [Hysterangium stoloniferum]